MGFAVYEMPSVALLLVSIATKSTSLKKIYVVPMPCQALALSRISRHSVDAGSKSGLTSIGSWSSWWTWSRIADGPRALCWWISFA